MLAAASVLEGCNDDTTYMAPPTQTFVDAPAFVEKFNPAKEARKVDCRRPEDFDIPDCHDPERASRLYGAAHPAASSNHGSSAFVFVNTYHGQYGYMPFARPATLSTSGVYGPQTPSARVAATARTATPSGFTQASSAATATVARSASYSASRPSVNGMGIRGFSGTSSAGAFGGTGRAVVGVSVGS